MARASGLREQLMRGRNILPGLVASGGLEKLPRISVSLIQLSPRKIVLAFAQQHTLHRIAKVLRPGGRLAGSVWCGTGRNPLAAALIGALQNGPHPAFSQALRWPFSVRSRREITDPDR